MRIVIEEPLHGSGRGGVTHTNLQMVRRLSRLDPGNDYSLFTYFLRGEPGMLERLQPGPGERWTHWHERWPERAVRAAEWGLGLPWVESRLKRKKTALYHCHRIPVTKRVPLVTTIHDLFTVVRPEWNSRWMIRLFEEVIRPGLERVERIIAISENTKRDLVERWGVAPGRVSVILSGVDRDIFHPLPAAETSAVRLQYRLPERFWLLVGPFDPWCDPTPAVEALARLPERLGDVQFVLAGHRGSCYEAVQKRAEELGLGRRLRWVGYVPHQDLIALYNLAQGFMFASAYEGFGLPVLEAMACGTPVVTSNTSALPEVAGGAALLCAPDDVEALRAAMASVADDDALRAALREKGLARAAALSWDETAKKTLAVYRSVLGA